MWTLADAMERTGEGQETTKDPKVEGSRGNQSSVTLPFRGTKARRTLVLLCVSEQLEWGSCVTDLC